MARTPAICGGTPAFPAGPPAWRPVPDAVAAALGETLALGTWSGYDGPNLARLGDCLRDLTGVEHVLPCSSGTIGVELALRGVGVAAGDEVILGGYDFPGNFRAVEAIGALPVLIDWDPRAAGLAADQIAAAAGPRTKAIVATHLHGGLVDMPRVCAAAQACGAAVVEDACQVPGAVVYGKPAGSWGDVAVFSFGGSKLLTSGRGGAIVTPRADVCQRAKIFSERGNLAFPLSELQATVLLPQFDALAEMNARRGLAAKRLAARLSEVPGLTPVVGSQSGCEPAFYKFGMLYDAEQLGGCSREDFCAAARAEGIALDAGFRGFALRSRRRCRAVGTLTGARAAAEQMTLLHHPILLESEAVVIRVAEVLAELADLLRRRAVTFTVGPSGDDLSEQI